MLLDYAVEYNYTNLQDFSDQQSIACGYHCLYFCLVKQNRTDICVTDIYEAYPDEGKYQHLK